MNPPLAGGAQQVSSRAFPLVVDTPSSASRRRYAALRVHAPAVVPSLLLCDFGHLADEVHRLEDAGASALHLDVMDGNFVPNLSYGLPVVEAVRRASELPIEAHLMISNPGEYLERFHAAGADALTFHYEAVENPRPLLEKIRSLGAEAGLAINPETPVSAIADCLDVCDLVLVMSVSPGFGGQKFEPVALEKLRELRSLGGPELILEVDGGVNDSTVAACAAAGAESLIVGSAIFNHTDYGAAISRLSAAARKTPVQ
jgi:ribulose-phosphate 3-epimerase